MGVSIVALHGLSICFWCGCFCGYNSGIISGLSKPLIECDFFPEYSPNGDLISDSSKKQSLFRGVLTATVLCGGMVGSLLGVPIADKYGRKKALNMFSLLGCTTAFLYLVEDFWVHVSLRFVAGLCIGVYYMLCPLYITETVHVASRGRVGTALQISICFSIFLAQFVNWISKSDYDATSHDPDQFCVAKSIWQLEFALGAIPAIVAFLYTYFILPESQMWIERSRFSRRYNDSVYGTPVESTPTFTRPLLGQRESPETFHDLAFEEEFGQSGEAPNGRLDDVEDSSSWFRLFCSPEGTKWAKIAIGLAVTSQLTGINVVIYYSPQIFAEAHIKNELLATFSVVGLWNFLSVFVSTLFVDRVGRKPLMVVGLLLMTVASFLLALVFGSLNEATMKSTLAICCILVYIFGFEIGPGALFFLLASEVFPRSFRGGGISFANLLSWIFNICVSFGFPILSSVAGLSCMFYTLAGVGTLSVVFTYWILPETKGTRSVD
mmetsp:Transcript_3153/g.4238  ORF Transcript_3153/g.4238 Transcript_3153/m.4238 type:complete len:494 (+) Transcript_3153:45-1526(+)